jgi:hypothetical protein
VTKICWKLYGLIEADWSYTGFYEIHCLINGGTYPFISIEFQSQDMAGGQ